MKVRRELAGAALALIASRLATLPRSLWEFDEPLFIEAVWAYEPLHHHPPPPGYPVFIALGKLLNFVFHDPFVSLVALSLIATVVGFIALAIALGSIAGDERVGIIGSLFFYFSPVMLVHSMLPISDPPALALLFLSLLFATRVLDAAADRDAVLFGFLCAMTVGCRPQFSIAVLPMFLWILAIARPFRVRLIALAAFAVTCVIWFVPLVLAAGGLSRWWLWMGEQASYFAAHDAALSRGGKSAVQIALRFIAHPWGPKWLSFPLLLLAAIGLFRTFRLRRPGVIALALVSLPYLVFCLLMMDPADGPRYGLPSLAVVALFVALAFAPRAGFVLVAVFAIGAATYVSTFIAERGRSASPPVQAALHAKRTIPRNSVILYELPLWPQAKLLFKDYTTTGIDDGLRRFSHRPEVPLYLYADGERGGREGVTFRWIGSDAYGKLTRNHYRVVSLLPIPATERYRPIRGVYPSERTVIGEQWRWLDQQAELELPGLGRGRVAITLGLPRNYPLDSNSVQLLINGTPAQRLTLRRGESSEVVVNIPSGPAVIGFRAGKSFVPAERPHTLDRDRRRLSFQLLRVRQL